MMMPLRRRLMGILQGREGMGAAPPLSRCASGNSFYCGEQLHQRTPDAREQGLQGEEEGQSPSRKARRGRIWWEKWKKGIFGESPRARKERCESSGDSKGPWADKPRVDRSAAASADETGLLKDRQLKAIQLQAREPRSAFHVALRRTELSAETGVAIRDLRAIDPSFHNQIATILARKASIVVNLAHVKAIITADRVYVFNFLDDRVWQRLLPNLQARLISDQTQRHAAPSAGERSPAGGVPRGEEASQGNAGRVAKREAFSLQEGRETPCCEARLEHDRCNPSSAPQECDEEEDGEIVREQGPFLADEHAAVAQAQEAVAPKAGEVPFEFRMLETMLESADKALWERFMATVPDTLEILKKFVKDEKDIVMEDQRRLLSLRNRLVRFGMEVSQIRAAFHDLLGNDEDMAEMYLTKKALLGGPVQKDQHSEVEELLEDYYKRVEEVANEVQTLLTTIDVTGEYLRTVLDSSRNKLIRLDVMINMATCSLAAGGTITGIFGMNLLSTLEADRLAFAFITTGVFCTTTLAFGMFMKYARKRRIL